MLIFFQMMYDRDCKFKEYSGDFAPIGLKPHPQ